MAVFVVDRRQAPLMPCSEKRARLLLAQGRARVHRLIPFTIRLIDREVVQSTLQPLELKIDPGSKTSGLALVRNNNTVNAETGEVITTAHVLNLFELIHRGFQISHTLTARRQMRRRRRSANLRYRAPRFLNRKNKGKGWLAPSLQHRIHLGGALSGRDTNAVNKTVSGLLELMYPDPEQQVSDEDLEWAVRFGLEVRRRVKEQQKRIGAAEFRNTHFSYTIGDDGLEKFVATPELRADNEIGDGPLEPDQVWSISEGGADIDDNAGLYRIEVNTGPGTGVKILNNPAPAAFKESLRYAEQNLYARSQQLIGDRDPRAHEFTVQLRAFDAAKRGSKLGVASLIAMCSSLLRKSVKGGLIVIGEINLGGSIEPVINAVNTAELAVEKGASVLLMPVTARRQLYDLSDDMATKIDIQFYQDARDALLKAIVE